MQPSLLTSMVATPSGRPGRVVAKLVVGGLRFVRDNAPTLPPVEPERTATTWDQQRRHRPAMGRSVHHVSCIIGVKCDSSIETILSTEVSIT